jgi:proteasome lid subunit RPN8/RPN11
MIVLSGKQEDSIRKEGKISYPNECCGILVGRNEDDDSRAVGDIIPIRKAEKQYHRFQSESEDLMKADWMLRAFSKYKGE